MFTLWYAVWAYKEFKGRVQERCCELLGTKSLSESLQKLPSEAAAKAAAASSSTAAPAKDPAPSPAKTPPSTTPSVPVTAPRTQAPPPASLTTKIPAPALAPSRIPVAPPNTPASPLSAAPPPPPFTSPPSPASPLASPGPSPSSTAPPTSPPALSPRSPLQPQSPQPSPPPQSPQQPQPPKSPQSPQQPQSPQPPQLPQPPESPWAPTSPPTTPPQPSPRPGPLAPRPPPRSIPRSADAMVDAAVLEKLEAGFKKLKDSDSKSLLKKHLTQEIFDKLKVVKTPSFGSTLLDVIQSGLENHDSGVGIYAPDAEAYSVFADLFDPIIEDYHGGFKKTDKHPPKDWGDVDTLGNLDPAGEYIISTRVRCGRSMQGYPFNPCLTEAQYKEMEDKVSNTLSGLEGELKGQFYPLTGMTKEVQQKLIDDHFLFKEGDRFLQAANACRFWPTGRGIYHNDAKTFLIWCNEEDHLRIISMQPGGDLGQVFRRLVTAVNDIEKRIPFSHDDRLGFLTFCPTNLGTTVRASVHIKLPKLAADRQKLEEVAGKYNLQVRGTRGEHTEAEGGVYDVSNKRRMGLTEYQAVKEMNDGIAELIKIEASL